MSNAKKNSDECQDLPTRIAENAHWQGYWRCAKCEDVFSVHWIGHTHCEHSQGTEKPVCSECWDKMLLSEKAYYCHNLLRKD
mgnify:CR=1 FL=1